MEFLKNHWLKLVILLGLILLLVVWPYRWYQKTYNEAIGLDEGVTKAWSSVETQYQRRMDLIPNLVKVVKAYAEHEKEVLIQVTEARSKASSIQVDPSKITPEMMKNFQGAQGDLSQALGRLLVTIEKYPDLKANQNFRDLQVQLEGTENRISVARDRYNEAVMLLNTHIKKFPNYLVLGGFDEKVGFQSEAGADKGVEVDL